MLKSVNLIICSAFAVELSYLWDLDSLFHLIWDLLDNFIRLWNVFFNGVWNLKRN